jgi:pimeloyl-ACP methyl ester carboxylesterase
VSAGRRPPIDALFLEGERRCYACLHHAQGRRERSSSLVVVAPIGQENVRAQRALRAVADGLANEGYYTLRLDLSGTGNSEGDETSATLSAWVDDVGRAVEWLRAQTGGPRVGLIGLRMGATIAAMFGLQRGTAHALGLWNPIVDGRAHLEELRATHEALGTCIHADRAGAEYLGFWYPHALCAEIAALPLTTGARAPAREVMVLESGTSRAAWSWDSAAGPPWAHQRARVSGPDVWARGEGPPAVCAESTRALAGWVAQVLP